MEEIPFQNRPVQRLMIAILPLALPSSGFVTHSGEIPAIGNSHKKKPVELFPKRRQGNEEDISLISVL
jgi:hypothetical protein